MAIPLVKKLAAEKAGFKQSVETLEKDAVEKIKVYVVEVDVLRPMKEHSLGKPKRTYHAVANVGFNPTFGGEGLHLEVHIFDFEEKIYGMPMRVRFFKRLREERKFSCVESLIEQITADVARAKAFFAGIM